MFKCCHLLDFFKFHYDKIFLQVFFVLVNKGIGGVMKLKPIFDRVVIIPCEKENVTKGGIYLPTTSVERPQIGKVIAVGEGGTFDGNEVEMKVKVGDKVLYNRYSGVEIKIDGEGVIILQQADIIAIILDE